MNECVREDCSTRKAIQTCANYGGSGHPQYSDCEDCELNNRSSVQISQHPFKATVDSNPSSPILVQESNKNNRQIGENSMSGVRQNFYNKYKRNMGKDGLAKFSRRKSFGEVGPVREESSISEYNVIIAYNNRNCTSAHTDNSNKYQNKIKDVNERVFDGFVNSSIGEIGKTCHRRTIPCAKGDGFSFETQYLANNENSVDMTNISSQLDKKHNSKNNPHRYTSECVGATVCRTACYNTDFKADSKGNVSALNGRQSAPADSHNGCPDLVPGSTVPDSTHAADFVRCSHCHMNNPIHKSLINRSGISKNQSQLNHRINGCDSRRMSRAAHITSNNNCVSSQPCQTILNCSSDTGIQSGRVARVKYKQITIAENTQINKNSSRIASLNVNMAATNSNIPRVGQISQKHKMRNHNRWSNDNLKCRKVFSCKASQLDTIEVYRANIINSEFQSTDRDSTEKQSKMETMIINYERTRKYNCRNELTAIPTLYMSILNKDCTGNEDVRKNGEIINISKDNKISTNTHSIPKPMSNLFGIFVDAMYTSTHSLYNSMGRASVQDRGVFLSRDLISQRQTAYFAEEPSHDTFKKEKHLCKPDNGFRVYANTICMTMGSCVLILVVGLFILSVGVLEKRRLAWASHTHGLW